MTGKAHRRFWKAFEKLPGFIQNLAREKYALWKQNPFEPSLGFEERRNGICVVRIGNNYRALGLREDNQVVWFWIGTHEEYNRFRF
ncbi:MAG: hypothetical protein ABJB69_06070 [Spartobacteria bacterium]